MTNRLALLTLPALLASCAPLGAMLSQEPSPMRAGPLVVGQVWTLTGLVDGRVVTSTLKVNELSLVPEGMGTANARTQYDAFTAGRPGFSVADYDQDRRVLRFRWIDENSSGDGQSYTCRIENPVGNRVTGVLSYLRGNLNVAQGTCEAVISQQP